MNSRNLLVSLSTEILRTLGTMIAVIVFVVVMAVGVTKFPDLPKILAISFSLLIIIAVLNIWWIQLREWIAKTETPNIYRKNEEDGCDGLPVRNPKKPPGPLVGATALEIPVRKTEHYKSPV